MEQIDFKNGKFPHAVLVENASENEVYRLACTAICRENEPPCGKCPDCIKAAAKTHPDIIIYKKDETIDKYNIKFVRQFLADTYILSNDCGRKVYIFYGADELSEQCQNAMLKTIEEPPDDVIFIFSCSSREKILETVLSRCVIITYNDQTTDSEVLSQATDILITAALEDEYELLLKMFQYKTLDSLRALCDALPEALQKIYLYRLVPEQVQKDDRLQEVVRRVSIPSVIKLNEAIQRFSQRVNSNGNIQLICTVFCADIKRALRK